MPNTPLSASGKPPRVPPRWFVTRAWKVHRALYRLMPGTAALSRAKPGTWGTMRLTVLGRRSGQERSVILAYIEDGADIVTMAMNGWGEGEPAWWLNLQANPEATLELKDGGPRAVTARRAEGTEHERLWDRYREVEDGKLDGYAAQRSTPTSLVILSPRA
ncbi:nitroreductase family deazaflavin-dependent oxidoreductase [Ornithinimicrobium faecis]|uniref:nitroreductase family deazaflavin-dependent oxidoreductase n=1 Tax=Ornithinimicrobium faecis TaxID=2934158 RepID=UPI0021188EF5|nr:nitroreductase family deazaflavin-dependent oxidoreductase [Ornithinimicrobium sp. HY1745]